MQSRSGKYIVLGTFSQLALAKHYGQTVGHCFPITAFWLLQHTFSPCKDIDELTANETKKFAFLSDHFADIVLLQKWYLRNPAFCLKKTSLNTLSELGISAFSDEDKEARIVPLATGGTRYKDPKTATIDERVNQLIAGLKHCLAISEQTSAFEFGFRFLTDNNKENVSGHAFGIVKNPCPGYEVLFFDCNEISIVFTTQAVFLLFMQLYLKTYYVKENITPMVWDACYVVDATPKPELINKPTATPVTKNETRGMLQNSLFTSPISKSAPHSRSTNRQTHHDSFVIDMATIRQESHKLPRPQ